MRGMGATVYWKPVSRDHKTIPVDGRTSFIEAMGLAFGDGPWMLDDVALPTLRGMAAANKAEAAYPFLIKKVEQDGAVDVWYEY